MARTHRIRLTDPFIKAAKVKPGRRSADFFDAHLPGFVLRVSSTGRKTFYIWHRDAAKKVQWTQVRDPELQERDQHYDVLTLKRARELATELLTAAKTPGRDPRVERDAAALQVAETHAQTFGKLAARYIVEYAKGNKSTWRDDESDIRTQLAAWHDTPVTDIRRRDVKALLAGIVARGAATRANRISALISGILTHGVDIEWLEHNVALRTKPTAEKKRTRRLDDDETRAFWAWLEQPPPADVDVFEAQRWRLMRALLKLRLITAQRANEILGMRWDDIDWKTRDNGPWWSIPVTKNGHAHRIPLTEPALVVLRELQQRAQELQQGERNPQQRVRDREGYVFVGIRGKRQRRKLLVDLPFNNFLPRDLRRTATTHMASLKVSRFDVKRVLNHTEGEVTDDYDLHAYEDEKRAALDKWAGRFVELLQPPTEPTPTAWPTTAQPTGPLRLVRKPGAA